MNLTDWYRRRSWLPIVKVFCLQTILTKLEESPDNVRVFKFYGFSLYAGVAARVDQRDKAEVRPFNFPPVS